MTQQMPEKSKNWLEAEALYVAKHALGCSDLRAVPHHPRQLGDVGGHAPRLVQPLPWDCRHADFSASYWRVIGRKAESALRTPSNITAAARLPGPAVSLAAIACFSIFSASIFDTIPLFTNAAKENWASWKAAIAEPAVWA